MSVPPVVYKDGLRSETVGLVLGTESRFSENTLSADQMSTYPFVVIPHFLFQ